MQKISLTTYLGMLAFAAWRLVQLLVVYPSALIGLLIGVFVLAGHSPIHETASEIFRYAEANVRPAKPGHVLVSECETVPASLGSTIQKPNPICLNPSMREVTLEEATKSLAETLHTLYGILVFLSGCLMVLLRPLARNRPFLGSWAAVHAHEAATSAGANSVGLKKI